MKRFEWRAVRPELTRSILRSVYVAAGQTTEAGKIVPSSRKKLAVQAEKSLGRPIRMKHMEAIVPVLRSQWLPALSRVELQAITTNVQAGITGKAKHERPTTKAEHVKFLKARQNTHVLRDALRRGFLAAHKVTTEPNPKPRKKRIRTAREFPFPFVLHGQSRQRSWPLHPHVGSAHDKLTKLKRSRGQDRGGLIVMPTGSGKTVTTVSWLIKQLTDDPTARVLWIADRQEIVDQAVRTFQDEATYQPKSFSKRIACIHSEAAPVTMLGVPHLDIACTTRQSLMGSNFDDAAKNRLSTFLSRGMNIVVIDEAHHAVSPTYRSLVSFTRGEDARLIVLGLTATPWPQGDGMTKKLEETIGPWIYHLQPAQLVKEGILARPIYHTVDTGMHVKITEEQAKAIQKHDVPQEVLRSLNRETRNDLVVSTWKEQRRRWGKTLVFACNIRHANRLTELFRAAGARVAVLHSESEVSRRKIIADFGTTSKIEVLVSVGMLTEGVDLPAARTAILARPTSSPILMRQMIGRVLRGRAAGGDSEAHVIDMRDRWGADIDILAPVSLAGIVGATSEDEANHQELPPIFLDRKSAKSRAVVLPPDVAEKIRAACLRQVENLPPGQLLSTIALQGFFELGESNVPVYDHTVEAWDILVDRILHGYAVGVARGLAEFDGLPVPVPTKADVRAVVDFVKSTKTRPPFVEARATASPQIAAKQLIKKRGMDATEQLAFVQRIYESSLNRAVHASFEEFYLDVQSEVFRQASKSKKANPEDPRVSRTRSTRQKLGVDADRSLDKPFRAVVKAGRELLSELAPELSGQLDEPSLPKIDWTRSPIKTPYAFWRPSQKGGSFQPEIRVNRKLQAPATKIRDELLEYLIWHELCHHILPSHRHDAEFRKFESAWENAVELDAELDGLADLYKMD